MRLSTVIDEISDTLDSLYDEYKSCEAEPAFRFPQDANLLSDIAKDSIDGVLYWLNWHHDLINDIESDICRKWGNSVECGESPNINVLDICKSYLL